MLATYRDNSLNWVGDVIRSSELFFSGTQSAENAFNSISFQTGNGSKLTDAKLGKEIDNSFYSYMISGTQLFKNNYKEYKYLTTTVPELVAKKQKDISEGKESKNYFLEELEIQTRKGKKYLGINNKNKPTQYQNEIYRAWMKLYDSYLYNEDGSLNKSKEHPDRKLAKNLVKYAFTGSGFQNNLTQFFTHIPHQILSDNNMSGDIRESIRKIDEIVTDSIFVDQFQRHSKENSKVVKSLDLKKMEGNKFAFIYKPAKDISQELGSKENNIRYFPKFVSARASDSDGKRVTYLYEQSGTVMRDDANGESMSVPVYTRTFELGTSEGKYKTFEYSKGNELTKSNNTENNVTPSDKIEVQKRLDKIMAADEFTDNSGTVIDQISIDNIIDQRISDSQIVLYNLDQIIEDQNIKCK
jgi:hypothetical protein